MIDRDTTITLIVGNEKYDFSTQSELMIDRADLDTEMARQAAHYAWFSVLHERARSERVRLEADYDASFARIDGEIRGTLENKKTTEAAIKARIRSDKRLLEVERKLQMAEHAEKLLGSLVEALYQRKDLLIALARSRHLEMSTPSPDEINRIKQNLMGRR